LDLFVLLVAVLLITNLDVLLVIGFRSRGGTRGLEALKSEALHHVGLGHRVGGLGCRIALLLEVVRIVLIEVIFLILFELVLIRLILRLRWRVARNRFTLLSSGIFKNLLRVDEGGLSFGISHCRVHGLLNERLLRLVRLVLNNHDVGLLGSRLELRLRGCVLLQLGLGGKLGQLSLTLGIGRPKLVFGCRNSL
jgi:hypothetical protein